MYRSSNRYFEIKKKYKYYTYITKFEKYVHTSLLVTNVVFVIIT